MKGKLVLVAILLAAFGIFVIFKFFILNNQNVYGKLKITSSPSASVFIDNVAVGRTPYEEKAKAGEFILKLIPEGNATETASWQGKVKVMKNALTYVNRELGSSDLSSAGEIFSISKMEKTPKGNQYGEISVETDPNGAIVYLDNDEKGIAPLLLADVVQGEHEISVNMPGFFKRSQKVHVEGTYRVNTSFKLAIDQSQTPTVKPTGEKVASSSATSKKTTVKIKDTPTGWLRVREEPNVDASESAKVNPGDKFQVIEEDNGWYKIEFEKDKTGWISAQYTEKQ